ncbi:FRG domain-containing protein [Kordia periserrulae]|uniref:FRG domain-containing protein n=1 Tax=Kordia periserrulae TaxID=701523 RepID=A0A2T6C7A2_9FLAO|nr:FRG domain-containing protein [Kordia periserrulae]PTX64194.1 FRG domain-containing protein [Kordia periserrulae]
MGTWYDFFEEIKNIKSEFENPETLWYRGHSSSRFELKPSLLRFKNGVDREQFLFQRFKDYSAKIFRKNATDWETLFDMQHYGVPTRLLDWSESPGVSIFFAVSNQFHHDEDGCFYILDPIALNSKSGQSNIKILSDDKDFKYQSIYWEKKPFSAATPIAIGPHFRNDRIYAQKGRFTIHGEVNDPLDIQCPDVVRKIIIPKEIKGSLNEFLQISNINALTIFPDMHGIAEYIKLISDLEY